MQSLLKTSVYSEIPWLNQLFVETPIHAPHRSPVERANVDMTPGLCFFFVALAPGGVAFFLTYLWAIPAGLCSHFCLDRAFLSLRLSAV